VINVRLQPSVFGGISVEFQSSSSSFFNEVCTVASDKESDADRTYRRYCPVRAWTRLRFLEGPRDRRWLWSETSTHFHW